MTRKQALIELRDKVKMGEAPLRLIDGCGLYLVHVRSAFNGSLDAARALHCDVLPPINQYTLDEGPSGCGCLLVIWPDGLSGNVQLEFHGYDVTPSRAWLLAILEALIAQEADE
jgi:hypothetical protein